MSLTYELVDIEDLIFPYEVFESRILEILKSYRVVHVGFIGLPQTGKTNQALMISNIINKYIIEKEGIPITLYYRFRNKQDIQDFPKALRLWKRTLEFPYKEGYRRPNVINIILDDLSFLIARYSDNVDTFMNYLTQIKHHLSWCRRIILYFIIHYSRATLPYLRITHIRGLTSLTTRYEVMSLKEYFNEPALWTFYNYKVNNPLNRVRFDTLYNLMGFEMITQPYRVDQIVGDIINLRSLYRFYKRLEKGKKEKTEIYRVIINNRNRKLKLVNGKDYMYIYYRNGKRYEQIAKLVRVH